MQDTGANLSSVAATVSLLVLIVVELASFVRNEIDGPGEVVGAPILFRMSERNCWLREAASDLVLFRMSNVNRWPSLGKLVVIHTINHVILTVSMSLIFSISGRPVSIALLIITFLIGLTLPMLEVGEYQEIRRAEVSPWSVILNGCTVIVTTAFSIHLPKNIRNISLDNLGDILGLAPGNLGYYISSVFVSVFLIFLTLCQIEYEMEKAALQHQWSYDC
jgi:uncharacterized membrane protein AbrB (regulator of aidB expression)